MKKTARKSTVTIILAAAAVLSCGVAHAQGLGGLLNKAKAKTSATANTSAAGAQTGGDPAMISDTPEGVDQSTRRALADSRAIVPGEDNNSTTNWYRQLVQLQNVHINYTWDQAALARASEHGTWIFAFIEDFADDLNSNLNAKPGPQLKPKLAKIKEIHFTTIDKKNVPGEFGTGAGWYWSFNPTTGVLTAAFTDQPYSVAREQFSQWILKHIS